MLDMFDAEIWIGLLALTALLYLARFLQTRCRGKVYRISSQSLERSKAVMLKVLPLVEDGGEDETIDDDRLPYPKENIKSAAKILAYYYSKENQTEELSRVRHCFISLSRFQGSGMRAEMREKRAESEKARLTREFECFIARAPFKSGKAA